ncbi:MAG: CCA tRNA nucleotidyltransferase [archaeon]|nr:CCA tRNA nucleotidyltransferase [archaeon]
MSIESEVIQIIRPSKKTVERIHEISNSLMLEINNYIKKNNLEVNARFVGSIPKGTYLSESDIDVFLMFPKSTPKDEMVNIGLKMGRDIIHGKEFYTDHPYTSGRYHDLDVDMVPCYHITSAEEVLTPVDRSPFHTDYILSKVNSELCDEIRLMKKFMKGIGTYGAESDVRGFSGYMCELITIYYGGFIDAIIAASEWKKGVTIVIEKSGPPIVSPIILYDPVDSKRNVASAVHIDTFARFIYACKCYLKNPTKNFFFPNKRKTLSREEIKKTISIHKTRLITVSFNKPSINEDSLHSQEWKTQNAIIKKLDAFSFNVIKAVHGVLDDRITIVFELEKDELSESYKHIGPPVWVKSSESFLLKWKKNECGAPFIDNGYWAVNAKRLYSTAAKMLECEIKIAGIGKEIDLNTMIITEHNETLSNVNSTLLSGLLDNRQCWEI